MSTFDVVITLFSFVVETGLFKSIWLLCYKRNPFEWIGLPPFRWSLRLRHPSHEFKRSLEVKKKETSTNVHRF